MLKESDSALVAENRRAIAGLEIWKRFCVPAVVAFLAGDGQNELGSRLSVSSALRP
jgi:hypothetical protein